MEITANVNVFSLTVKVNLTISKLQYITLLFLGLIPFAQSSLIPALESETGLLC